MGDTGLGTSLKRLSQHDGEWVLEVERLVPLGRHLHQPVQQKIEGAALIGRHLRAVPELSAMAEPTEAVMQQEEAAEAYELWKGDWLDVEMVRALSLRTAQKAESVRSGAGPAGGASRKAVAKLERTQLQLQERIDRLEHGGAGALGGQFEKMAALIETLTDKVAALEAKLGMDPEESAALVAAAKERAAEEGENSSDGAEASAQEDGAGEEAAASGEESADSEASAAEEGTPEAPKRPEKRMRPPSAIAMRQSLEMLVGEEIGLKECAKHVDFDDGTFFRVRVLDDTDVLVGTMIADLEATVRLACKLLMLPEGEVRDQLAANEASEDSVETMSEIFNTMSATINNVKSNPHVRTTPLEEMDPAEFAWVKTTKRRIDVDVEGGGIMSICAV